jgi:hypothetical protein
MTSGMPLTNSRRHSQLIQAQQPAIAQADHDHGCCARTENWTPLPTGGCARARDQRGAHSRTSAPSAGPVDDGLLRNRSSRRGRSPPAAALSDCRRRLAAMRCGFSLVPLVGGHLHFGPCHPGRGAWLITESGTPTARPAGGRDPQNSTSREKGRFARTPHLCQPLVCPLWHMARSSSSKIRSYASADYLPRLGIRKPRAL